MNAILHALSRISGVDIDAKSLKEVAFFSILSLLVSMLVSVLSLLFFVTYGPHLGSGFF